MSERARDDLATPLFDITDAIAGFGWTLDELRGLAWSQGHGACQRRAARVHV